MKTYSFDDGKYSIFRDDNGLLTAKRHGEEWPGFEDLKHVKLIGAMLDQIDDLGEVLEDKRRLTSELDVALNGAVSAAKQPALCDLLSQAINFSRKNGPALAPRAACSDLVILQPKVPLGTGPEIADIDAQIDDLNQHMLSINSGVRFMYVGEGFNVYIAEDRSNGQG